MLERLKSIAMNLNILEKNILSAAKTDTVLADTKREVAHFKPALMAFPNMSQEQIRAETEQISARLQRFKKSNTVCLRHSVT